MSDARFRRAARVYLGYAVVYWIGGIYLVAHGVGVPGGAGAGVRMAHVAFWGAVGLVPMLVIPYLLRRPRAWFQRWILSRRDFARLLALFLAFRAYKIAEIALRPEGASVPAPWGGAVGFQVGAMVFFPVTAAALVAVALAAWGEAEP